MQVYISQTLSPSVKTYNYMKAIARTTAAAVHARDKRTASKYTRALHTSDVVSASLSRGVPGSSFRAADASSLALTMR